MKWNGCGQKLSALFEVKVKVTQGYAYAGTERRQWYSSNPVTTSTLKGDGWSAPHADRFTPGKDPISMVKEAGFASGPVWTGTENLAFTGIRSSDGPVRCEPLYCVHHPGRPFTYYPWIFLNRLRRTTKDLGVSGLRTDIRSWDLPNMREECCSLEHGVRQLANQREKPEGHFFKWRHSALKECFARRQAAIAAVKPIVSGCPPV
jgi:hypothetical protein